MLYNEVGTTSTYYMGHLQSYQRSFGKNLIFEFMIIPLLTKDFWTFSMINIIGIVIIRGNSSLQVIWGYTFKIWSSPNNWFLPFREANMAISWGRCNFLTYFLQNLQNSPYFYWKLFFYHQLLYCISAAIPECKLCPKICFTDFVVQKISDKQSNLCKKDWS